MRGGKNMRNIKSFNEPANAFCKEFAKRLGRGGFRARIITLAREDWAGGVYRLDGSFLKL